MPVYLCRQGDTANVALEEPGCFVLTDAVGKDWWCVRTNLPAIPGDLAEMVLDEQSMQLLSARIGACEEGSAFALYVADDREALARKLYLWTCPPWEETRDRLTQAGWSYRQRVTTHVSPRVRLVLTDGRRVIEAQGDGPDWIDALNEAWHSAAQQADAAG